jgi:hypothetical protein
MSGERTFNPDPPRCLVDELLWRLQRDFLIDDAAVERISQKTGAAINDELETVWDRRDEWFGGGLPADP